MNGLGLTIQADDLQEILDSARRLEGAAGSGEVKLVMGEALQEVVRTHFYGLAADSEHHQTSASLGANRTGFYLTAAADTHGPQIDNDGVSVSIEKAGLAQRYFGGTIEAKAGSFLTIPAKAQFYGVRARDLDNLRLIVFPSGIAALVEKGVPADEGGVAYWLVRSVTQQADHSVLPKEEEMLGSAVERAKSYMERVFKERKAT